MGRPHTAKTSGITAAPFSQCIREGQRLCFGACPLLGGRSSQPRKLGVSRPRSCSERPLSELRWCSLHACAVPWQGPGLPRLHPRLARALRPTAVLVDKRRGLWQDKEYVQSRYSTCIGTSLVPGLFHVQIVLEPMWAPHPNLQRFEAHICPSFGMKSSGFVQSLCRLCHVARMGDMRCHPTLARCHLTFANCNSRLEEDKTLGAGLA